MKFNVNQQDLQQALNYCQGVIEKRSTLPILSNILLDVNNSKLTITATDLDLIFIHQLNNVEILEEGKTTTTSSIMYDIIRKFNTGKKINLSLTDISKLQVESEKSIFNLNCISATEFPLTDENFNQNEFIIKSKQLLKLFMNSITSLRLYGPDIGDEGVKVLAEALITNSTLKELHLSNNNIGDEGAAALAEAAIKNPNRDLLDESTSSRIVTWLLEKVTNNEVSREDKQKYQDILNTIMIPFFKFISFSCAKMMCFTTMNVGNLNIWESRFKLL